MKIPVPFFHFSVCLSPLAIRLELLLFNCSQFDFIFTNRRLLIACNSDTNKQKRKMLNALVRFIDWGGQAWEAIQFHFSMNECRSWYFRCSHCHPAILQYWMARCSQWMNRCQTVHIAGAKFHRTSDRMWCEQSQFVAAVTITMYLWIVHTCDGDRKTCVVSTVAGPDGNRWKVHQFFSIVIRWVVLVWWRSVKIKMKWIGLCGAWVSVFNETVFHSFMPSISIWAI